MGQVNKGRAGYLKLGDYNAVCYECGMTRKASQMKRHWKGYWVCPEHWEPREAQDFVKTRPDFQTPPWIQDRPTNNFTITDLILCEDSNIVSGVLDYLTTELSYPLETEN